MIHHDLAIAIANHFNKYVVHFLYFGCEKHIEIFKYIKTRSNAHWSVPIGQRSIARRRYCIVHWLLLTGNSRKLNQTRI